MFSLGLSSFLCVLLEYTNIFKWGEIVFFMRKVMALMLVGMFVFSVGLVSAKTLVAGKIYNADYSKIIEEALVVASCDNGAKVTVQNTMSIGDGSYGVEFYDSDCNFEDLLTVYAEKDGMTGSQTGRINKDVFGDWDLAIANVPLVPEFGFVIGMLTILSAVGIFFVIRKD